MPEHHRADNPVGYPSYALTMTMTRHASSLVAPCARVAAIRERSGFLTQQEIYNEVRGVPCNCGAEISKSELLR